MTREVDIRGWKEKEREKEKEKETKEDDRDARGTRDEDEAGTGSIPCTRSRPVASISLPLSPYCSLSYPLLHLPYLYPFLPWPNADH